MGLEGNLRDFSLEHIFQLIHTGKKTGTLHIVRGAGEAEAFVYFRNGKIFGAVSNFNRVPIGELLVNAKHITSEDLKRALELQRNDKKRRKLGQILVAEGMITPDILKQIVREQIQSTVFDLLPWEEGEFQFLPQLPAMEDIGLLVSARKVLLDSSQRLNEWDRVREQVPSLGAVFAINDMAPRHKDITLSPRHWKLLRFIDGNRSVTELALIAKTSEFETSSILYDLVDAGLLRLMYEKESGKNRSSIPGQELMETEPEASKIELQAAEGPDKSGAANQETVPEKVEPDQADLLAEPDENEVNIPESEPAASEPAATVPKSLSSDSDFQPELDIDGLDSMVTKELISYRSEFMNELTALTDSNWTNARFRPSRSGGFASIKIGQAVERNIINKALNKLK